MINKIQAKNFKILEFVDINPKKGVTFVFGPNEAGKSTVMDIVENTLVGGKKILNPIRDNQEKAETVIVIDNYKIKKVFTKKGQRLEVYDADNNKVTGGLKLIDRLINKIGFDPHQFTRMNAKEQREMLMKLLNLDFTSLDTNREKLFMERRDIGVQAKALPNHSQTDIEFIDKYEGQKEVSAVELSNKLQKARGEHINYSDCQDELEENKAKITDLENEIKELSERNKNLLSVKKPISDVPALQKQLSEVEETNQKIRKAKMMGDEHMQSYNLGKEYKEKTKKIEMIDTHKQNVLKNAKMPLDKLALTDECVTYNDRPFDQLSTSQKMKVSTTICLMLMDDDKDKVIILREGNLFDDKSLDVIEKICLKENEKLKKLNEDKKCYFLIEMVLSKNSEIPKQGILIQEGKIVAVDGEPVK